MPCARYPSSLAQREASGSTSPLQGKYCGEAMCPIPAFAVDADETVYAGVKIETRDPGPAHPADKP